MTGLSDYPTYPEHPLGRTNLIGQQKPGYLLNAEEAVDTANKIVAAFIDKDFSVEIIQKAQELADNLEAVRQREYETWQKSIPTFDK